mgnify:FL=1
MPSLPNAIQEVLVSALEAKDQADAAKTQADVAAQAVAAAVATKGARDAESESRNAELTVARERLDAVLDAYLRPGASAPAAESP